MKSSRAFPAALALAGLFTGSALAPQRAHALSIELKDVAADRVDRQRSFQEGALPLPGTPNVSIFDKRLKAAGLTLRSPMMIRVFKAESELEVWKEKDGALVLFASYPICHWSGSLGPKLREGDKQAPEGFYTVTKKQLRHFGRWPRSLHINFPNVYDQSQARTGTDILIHGGCTSVGCFAMTNPVSDEIHRMTEAAIEAGQEHVPIHIYPFRMSDENMRTHASPAWQSFWSNLKEGYDLFERTKRAPLVSACDGRYHFSESAAPIHAGPLDVCATTIANIKEQEDWLNGVSVQQPVAGPVRTAAADVAPMGLGGPRVIDAVTPAAPVTAPVATAAPTPAASPEAVLEQKPSVRCRFALRVCRKTASLKGIQAARRANKLTLGMKRAFAAHARNAAAQ